MHTILYRRAVSSPWRRAEGDNILFGCTVHQRCRRIKSIAIIIRACIFKHLRVHAWLAFLRASIFITATEWVKIESQASAFASHNFPIFVEDLELHRARIFQIFWAPSDGTFRWDLLRCYRNRKVIAINQAHIIKIWLGSICLKWYLHKCNWRCAYETITC